MPPQQEDGLPQNLLSSLITTTPWNEQVQSLTHLTELALSPSPQTLRQLRSLTPYFQSAISNPRSTLVRSVCETISTLAETLKAPFVEAVGNSIIPSLLNRSAVTKAVIRESCVNAARSMFEHGVEGMHFVTVKTLAEVVSDRRTPAPTRATAALFLGMILVDNCREGVHHVINIIGAAIVAGCSDPDESVRATSRENWRRLHALDPSIASELLNSLPPQTVQLINRERDEFGDPFRGDRDRAARARMPGMADMPTRFVPRVGFRPARVEIDEQPTQRKSRPHLRPPRRSVLPGAFANLQPTSPDDSPPKRNEMHPARRVFSPMTIDGPGAVNTPATVNTPAAVHTPASVDTPALVDTPSVIANEPTWVERAPVNDLSSPKQEESPLESKKIASESMGAATENSAVSAVSCSSDSGSHPGTPDSPTPLTDHGSHTTESSMSSVAGTENAVSAVSSSSVSTASTTPSVNVNGGLFKKIAGSGVSRGTNEDSHSYMETPPRSPSSGADSVSAHTSSPDTKKGRLSFILGTNCTPRVYTPLPPVSRIIETEGNMQTFTPMDICTPMKNDDNAGPLSGVVMKPLARTLEDGLAEVAPSDNKDSNEDVGVANEVDEQVKEEKSSTPTPDVSPEKDVRDEEEETSPKNEDGRASEGATQNSADFDEVEQIRNDDLLETEDQTSDKSNLTEGVVPSAKQELSKPSDQSSTPESIEDELLQQVASLTSSAEKKQDSADQNFQAETSWDTLVQDLEKTLGLRAPVTDEPTVSEEGNSVDPAPEQTGSSVKLETVKPGDGKENKLPVDPHEPPEVPKSLPEAKVSTKMEDKEKGKTEMTKAERQAALARRPPRRSINPGAIKPMPVEKKTVRPSLPPPVPPRTERRKPPVPSFSRKPPVPGKPPTANKDSTVRPPSTAPKLPAVAQKPPSTARKPPLVAQKPRTTAVKPSSADRKPPTAARKLPNNRPRLSTALTRPSASVPPVSSVRRASTPPVRPGQSSAAKTANKPSTTQSSASFKPVSALPPKAPKAPARNQTPRQVAVIDAYRACVRTKKSDWSTRLKSLKDFEAAVKALQGDSLPPRLCDDATAVLGEYAQENHHKVQHAALDALFFLLLCTERPPQITALHRALEKRPEILRRVLGLLKDGREDVRLACGRVMQSFEVLFGPEVQVALLVKAVSGVEGKIAEMGCVHMLKTFERAKQGDGFVWKAGVLENLVSLLAGLKQNRRVEVRQAAAKVLDAVKNCLPDRAFDIVCKKVGVSV